MQSGPDFRASEQAASPPPISSSTASPVAALASPRIAARLLVLRIVIATTYSCGRIARMNAVCRRCFTAQEIEEADRIADRVRGLVDGKGLSAAARDHFVRNLAGRLARWRRERLGVRSNFPGGWHNYVSRMVKHAKSKHDRPLATRPPEQFAARAAAGAEHARMVARIEVADLLLTVAQDARLKRGAIRIFKLHFVAGWSARAIASHLEVSESTVRRELARVLELLASAAGERLPDPAARDAPAGPHGRPGKRRRHR